ncbi:MAG: hypothetical protein WCF26_07650 [Candidatus Sulfotelmatobacter sp.]
MFADSSNPRAVLTERVDKPDPPPVYDVGNHSLVLFDRGDANGHQARPPPEELRDYGQCHFFAGRRT